MVSEKHSPVLTGVKAIPLPASDWIIWVMFIDGMAMGAMGSAMGSLNAHSVAPFAGQEAGTIAGALHPLVVQYAVVTPCAVACASCVLYLAHSEELNEV